MRGMATLPQDNQELLVVRDKVGRPPGELGVSKSMECDIFPFIGLTLLVGQQERHPACKKLAHEPRWKPLGSSSISDHIILRSGLGKSRDEVGWGSSVYSTESSHTPVSQGPTRSHLSAYFTKISGLGRGMSLLTEVSFD